MPALPKQHAETLSVDHPRNATDPAEFLAQPDLDARIRAKEPAVLRTIVETYLPQIFRAARGAGLRPQDAEDVTQETFATFLDSATRFEGRSHVRTFILGILYRKIAEARRGFSRQRQHDPIDEVIESRFSANGSWSHPPAKADRLNRVHEIQRALKDCLEASPAPQRLAFHLREVEGLKRKEICETLDVSSSNLDVMLHRLRNRTRECLEAKNLGATL